VLVLVVEPQQRVDVGPKEGDDLESSLAVEPELRVQVLGGA
jgi:hypothetical protein